MALLLIKCPHTFYFVPQNTPEFGSRYNHPHFTDKGVKIV
jgi:hypothetical protein